MFKFFVLLFTPVFLCAQQTKTITKEIDGTGIKHVYSVIDTSDSTELKDNSNKNLNSEVIHGKFQTFHHETLLTEGFYKLGMKDSLWKEFNRTNGKLSGSGMYNKHNKDGWWVYYDKNEMPIYKTNHTTKESVIFDSLQYKQHKEESKQVLEKEPEFRGGLDELMNFINKNLQYPKLAKKNDIEGRVYVTFVIDEIGNLNNIKILNGIGGGCDEEALRIVGLMQNKWIPGFQNGVPVRVQYKLPIIFRL